MKPIGPSNKELPTKTAWYWLKARKLPVKIEQMPAGTLIVTEPSYITHSVRLYGRVSGSDQKGDLEGR